jgi:hypothetical protein
MYNVASSILGSNCGVGGSLIKKQITVGLSMNFNHVSKNILSSNTTINLRTSHHLLHLTIELR